MTTMKAFGAFLVIAVLYVFQGITTAAPIVSNKIRVLKCSPQCSQSRNFNYVKAMSYRFAYNMEASTQMGGANKEEARLSVRSDVKIDVLGRCEMALRLHNTQLEISNERGIMKNAKKEELSAFKQAVRSSSLRFSFQDGAVTHLCLEAGNTDPPWVLNFKRGILSLFQTGLRDWGRDQNITETDIVGECETQYRVIRKTPFLVDVTKVKDILGCRKRQGSGHSVFSVPYGLDSTTQSPPIHSSVHECKQSLGTSGVLQQAHCTEKHVFRPLSQGHAEVSTTIKQSLLYIKKRREGKRYRGRIVLRQPLTFDHSAYKVSAMRGRFEVEKILRDICRTTELDVRTETPRVYADLVSKMKLLDRTDMERVHYLLKTEDLCSSNDIPLELFLDALPSTATRPALKLMTSLLISGDISGIRATLWMTSVGFIATPTAAMLKEVKPLLEHGVTRSSALLPVSSLVYNFCQHHVTECSNHRGVSDLVTSIQENIGHWCDARGRKQGEVLLSLRALGNAGHVTRAVSLINKCLIRASNPLGVRIAAAESFRRMPCEKQRRHRRYLWELFTSSNVDPELRITSYLAVARCADVALLRKVLDYVDSMVDDARNRDNEGKVKVSSDAEVKAFVYSHLKHIRDSSSPHKQQLREEVKRLNLKSGVAENQLNISRHVELSTLNKQLNAGITADGNLVWSGDSQLPRALSANLTLELFGRSINVLDIGARVTGFEDHLKTAYQKYEQGKLGHWLKRHLLRDVDGQAFLRVFGNEILFLRSSDLASIFPGLGQSRSLPAGVGDLLTRLSGDHDKSITRAMPILDVSMTIPTISGFPIHLAANGSAIVDLRFKGTVDLRKVISKSRSFSIDGELKASAAAEITGSLSLDAAVTRVGLRMRNTARFSAVSKGHVQLDKESDFNFHLDTPLDEVEIFEARSKFFTVHGDREKRKESLAKDQRVRSKLCTGKKVAVIFGLELCTESQTPISSLQTNYAEFLLNGPARISTTVYKRDKHDAYRLSAKLSQTKRNGMLQVQFDTPGSKVNRVLSLDSAINYPQREIDTTILLPWRRTTIKVTLANRRGFHLATGSVIMSETGDSYSCAAEMRVITSKFKMRLKPKVTLSMPRGKEVGLDGIVNINGELALPSSIGADLKLSGLGRTATTLQGKITNTDQEKSLSLTIEHKQRFYSFQCVNKMTNLPRKGLTIETGLDVLTSGRRYVRLVNSLSLKKSESVRLQTHVEIYGLIKKLQLQVSLSRSVKAYSSNYDAELWVKSPTLSAKFEGEVRTSAHKLMTSKFALNYLIPEVTKNQIQIKTKFENKGRQSQNTKWMFTSILNIKSNPEYDLDIAIGLGLHQRQDNLDLRFRYGNDPNDERKQVRLNFLVKKQIRGLHKMALSYSIKAGAPLVALDVTLAGKHQHTTKKLDTSFSLHEGSSKKVAVTVRLENKSRRLKKYTAGLELFWGGQHYDLTTNFDQKSIKHLAHRVTLTHQGVMIYDLLTQVETPKFKAKLIKTEIFSPDFGRVLFEASGLVHSRRLRLDGKMTHARSGNAYGFEIDAIRPRDLLSVKIGSEIYFPGRRITLKMTGANRAEKRGGQLEVNLHADRPSCGDRCMINLKSLILKKKTGETERVWTKLDLTTPFRHFTKLGVHCMYATNSSSNFIDGNVYWGAQRKKRVTGALKIRKPLSWDSVQADVFVKTPLVGYQLIESEISHKLSPEMVTLLNAVFDLLRGEVQIFPAEGLVWQTENTRDFKLITDVDSNLKLFSKKLSMALEHHDDERKIKSSYTLVHNKDTYSCDVSSDLTTSDDLQHFQNSGEVIMKAPGNVMSATWNHKHTMATSKSSVQSSWNTDTVMLVLEGSQKGWDTTDAAQRTVGSTLTLESTAETLKNITVAFEYEQRQTQLKNTIEILDGLHKKNADLASNDRLALSKLQASWEDTIAEVDYALDTSLRETPITAKVNVSASSLPYTADAVLVWSGNETFSAQASVTRPHWDDLDLQIKVETPYRKFPKSILNLKNRFVKDDEATNITQKPNRDKDFGDSETLTVDAVVLSSNGFSNLELSVLSPLNHHKNVTLSAFYKGQDPKNIEANAEAKVNEAVKLAGEFKIDRVTFTRVRLSGDMATQNTPGTWQSVSNITIDHRSRTETKYIETSAVLKHKAKTVSFQNKLSITEQNSFAYSIVLFTPLKRFKKLGAEVNYQRKANNFIAQVESTVGKKFHFQGKMENKGSRINKKLTSFWTVTTPLTDTMVYDLTFVNNREGGEFKSALSTPFENFREFLVHGACFKQSRSFINVTGELRMPFAGLKKTELSHFHSKQQKRFKSGIGLECGSLTFGSDMDVNYHKPDMEATLHVDTGKEKLQASTRYRRVSPKPEAYEISSLSSSSPSSSSSSPLPSTPSSSSTSSFLPALPPWLQMFLGNDKTTASATASTTTTTTTARPPAIEDRHELMASVDLGQGKLYKLDSNLDLRSQPIIFSAELDTPLEDLQRVEALITHRGRRLKDFQTTGLFVSPLTDAISVSALSHFAPPSEASAEVSLKASKLLPVEMNDWMLRVKSQTDHEGIKRKAELQWAENRQITVVGGLTEAHSQDVSRKTLFANVSTPFEKFRENRVMAEYSKEVSVSSPWTKAIKMEVKQDETVDLDIDLRNIGRTLAKVEVRRPWKAHLIGESVNLSQNDGRLVKLSWRGPIPGLETRGVEGEIIVNTTGSLPFNARLAATNRNDVSKTLTFTSQLMRNADSDICCNHSLQVNLKCPASDLDLSTTSHLAMTPDEVDAKVKLTYFDKSGRNKIAALSGKLHKLRKILRLIISTTNSSLQLTAGILDGVELSGSSQQSPTKMASLLKFPYMNITHLFDLAAGGASPLSRIPDDMLDYATELHADFKDIEKILRREISQIWEQQVDGDLPSTLATAATDSSSSYRRPPLAEVKLHHKEPHMRTEEEKSDATGGSWWFGR